MANGPSKQVIQVGGSANDKGYFADLTALQIAYPTGQNGWYAILGSTDTVWVWDSGTSAWVDSGGSSTGTNLSYTASASNGIVVSDTGTDATIPLANGTNAGLSLNDYTTAEKTKLSGIATGAEVNVNADWNSVSGDSQILNKPTISGSNTGDQTSIVGITGTKAQFDTAVTDGNFMYIGDAPTAHTHLLANITDVTMTVANLNSLDDGVNSTLHFHDSDRARANHTGTQLASTISDFTEASQDATGSMVDTSLVYVDATPLLTRAALTGAITAPQGSNATSLGSFTTAQLNTALSDNDVATGGGTATGTNTGDNAVNTLYSGLVSNATHTGDATGATALTLATVNSNVGSFGLAGSVAQFVVNAKGLITSAVNVAISIASTAISDFASASRAQTEAELVAGANITITPSGAGATRQLTIASTGGGGTLTVQDEGSTQSTTVTTLNFTGAGVTASGSGATATINISGGGGGSSTKGIAEVDFGVIGQESDIAVVTVTDASITTTSYPSATMYSLATTDHDPDDYMAEGLTPYVTNIVNGVGFDIAVRAPNLTWGKYKVTYLY